MGQKNKKLIVASVILAFIFALHPYDLRASQEAFGNLRYVVTDTGESDSFDPNDGDKLQNSSVMRMLYATPLEIDKNNVLGSYILKSFTYDENLRQVRFVVREDLKFSDGTQLSIEDVALAIARTAHFRPDFPVIKHIEGVKEWSKSERGLTTLPKGMSIHGNTLLIQFTRKIANPLYRFCLELFSVIPKSCIDPGTGKMTCDRPPSSGYYTLKSRSNKELHFERVPGLKGTVGEVEWETITFQYKTIQEACRGEIDNNQIIAAIETDFRSAQCGQFLTPKQVHWTPSENFLVLRFNPEVSLFSTREARRFFAGKVRSHLKMNFTDVMVETSLFSRLLPGYLSAEEFTDTTPNLGAQFLGKEIKLSRISSYGSLLIDAVEKVAKDLGMLVEVEANPKNAVDSFLAGKFPVVGGGSNFWAQDPVGDVSMWFTKDLHKSQTFSWRDNELYRLLEILEAETNPKNLKPKMEALNRHIVSESLVAPMIHFRRCFITGPRTGGINLSSAIIFPAPWQLSVVK